jgi:hypothetical protein
MVLVVLFSVLSAVWTAPTFSMTTSAKKSRSGEINLSGISSGSSGTTSSSSSRGNGLTQIPSENTDFLGDDPSQVEVHVTSAKKDIVGAYHVRGDVKNLGNDTLQFVKFIKISLVYMTQRETSSIPDAFLNSLHLSSSI